MGKGSFKCKDCGETFETFYTEGGIRAGINLPHCPKCGSGNTRKYLFVSTYMMTKKLLFLFMLFVFNMGNLMAESLPSNEQKQLVSSLNYLQYSTARIKMSENKAIAEDIYYSIINELKIEAISDRELNFEYGEFLAKCANLKLTQNEKDFIKQLNEKAQKNAYLSAFSNFGSVFVPGQSPQQMVASLVYTSVASAVAIANTKNQLKTQLEKDMFNLDQQIMKDIFDIQTSLFTTSAKLLGNSTSLGLITENSMNIFMKAIKLESAGERKNALSEPQLQNSLSLFPPYWFELGNAYYELGDTDNAVKAYNQFVNIKQNDIVLKDKNYVNLIKSRIQILLGSDPAKVLSNAQLHKDEIEKYIDILKANYLDSEAGEKNAYLAKIYYLIGCSEESLKCLDYIINTRSVYPDLIEEAVTLKLLIKSSNNNTTAALYQNSFNFSKVVFGDANVDYSKLPVKKSWWRRMFNTIVDFFTNLFSSSDTNDASDGIQINSDDLCVRIPKALINSYTISFTIDDVLYVPKYFNCDKYTSLCFIDYDYDDIDEESTIVMHCKSKSSRHDVVVKYRIQPIKTKIVHAAEKAYKRIGSDIIAHNAQTAVEFGQLVVDYDYEIDDEEELNEDIREEIEDEGTENHWTKEEIDSKVTKELSLKLAPDIKFLQERSFATEKVHYANKENLYSPSLVTYDDDYYLIGIESIYDSKTNKKYIINSSGDIGFKKEVSKINIIKDITYLTKVAIGGDINSMVSLGIAYIEGYNIEKDPKEGIIWLLTAINSDKKLIANSKMSIAQAYKYLGQCYWEGEGVVKDKNQARKYFRKSKEYGYDIDEDYL